jgi:hypothetical protein
MRLWRKTIQKMESCWGTIAMRNLLLVVVVVVVLLYNYDLGRLKKLIYLFLAWEWELVGKWHS